MANTASSVLDVARREIGYSRWSDPQNGTKYGRWYATRFGSYFASNGVPFCAMFVSWVFDQAGAKAPGVPGAYCPTMLAAGGSAGRLVDKKSAQPGDLVYFDWGGDGVTDHIGIIEQNNGSYCTTIEGNTDNGQVKRKTRAWSTVCGVVRPPYGSSAPAAPKAPAKAGAEAVRKGQKYLQDNGFDVGRSGIDGEYGPDTRRASSRHMQYQLTQCGQQIAIDGIVGPATKAAFNRCGHVYKGHGKKRVIKGVQAALLCHGHLVGGNVDGVCGDGTDGAIRAFQKSKGITADGIVGPQTFALLF